MKLSSSILVVALALSSGSSIGATTPVPAVDYSRNNARFAPAAASQRPQSKPIKLAPAPQSTLVDFEQRSFTAKPASKSRTLRPAAVVRPQKHLSPDRRRPNARPASAGQLAYPNTSHVVSPVVRSFGRVDRYQRQLSSADAVYIGRTPALNRSGTARLNRFLFRRSDSAEVVTPTAVRAGAGDAAQR